MGISDIHVFPITMPCLLQGTLCDTGIPCTFYGENICSVYSDCRYILISGYIDIGPAAALCHSHNWLHFHGTCCGGVPVSTHKKLYNCIFSFQCILISDLQKLPLLPLDLHLWHLRQQDLGKSK